ncbi:MAG: hypothetical protein JNM76_05450 [Betaproteobacteria bacterium]|nr:hypothetical protein [Betaproteobacteria bacterium]
MGVLRIFATAIVLLIGVEAWAATPTPTSKPPNFVDVKTIDLKAVLPPPPDTGSLADQTDKLTLLAVQAARSPAESFEAKRDAGSGPMPWAASLLGADFSAEKYPQLAKLLADVRDDYDPLAHVSPHPARKRPSEQDARVQPLVPFRHASYPSARTMGTRIWAHVIGDVMPQHRAALVAHAEKSAWLRVVAGVHFPSDLAGGLRVADAFIARLSVNEAYRARIVAARKEADDMAKAASAKAAQPSR